MLAGTWRRDRDGGAADPKPSTPDAPPELGEIARRAWGRLAPLLAARALMADDYSYGLSCLCTAIERRELALRVINDPDPEVGGLTFKAPSGYPQQRPEVSILERAEEAIRKWSGEFGLTPAMVQKVTPLSGGANKPANRFQGIG